MDQSSNDGTSNLLKIDSVPSNIIEMVWTIEIFPFIKFDREHNSSLEQWYVFL